MKMHRRRRWGRLPEKTVPFWGSLACKQRGARSPLGKLGVEDGGGGDVCAKGMAFCI